MGVMNDRGESSGRSQSTQAWIDELRAVRFDVRAQMTAGELTLDEVFTRATETVERNGVEHESPLWPIKLLWVLESLPHARKVDTRRKLEELGMSESQPIGTLSNEQRSLLLSTFPLSSAESTAS